jgi:hypothetical protein
VLKVCFCAEDGVVKNHKFYVASFGSLFPLAGHLAAGHITRAAACVVGPKKLLECAPFLPDSESINYRMVTSEHLFFTLIDDLINICSPVFKISYSAKTAQFFQ